MEREGIIVKALPYRSYKIRLRNGNIVRRNRRQILPTKQLQDQTTNTILGKVGKVFNQYFGHITDSIDLHVFPDIKVCEGLGNIDNIVYKFRNHLSIVKIKEQYKVKSNFSFRLVTTEEIKAIIRDLSTNILKKSNFSFDELTKCVNYALTNGKFPITLDDPTDKTNFRQVSVLPLLSKVSERVIYNQLGKYMDTFLNKLLCF